MTRRRLVGIIGGAVVLGACIGTYVMATDDSHDGTVAGKELPTGKTITPAAARGAFFQDLRPLWPGLSGSVASCTAPCPLRRAEPNPAFVVRSAGGQTHFAPC